MLQWVWCGMVAGSVLFGLASGQADKLLGAALAGTGDAIAMTLKLGAGYLFFCGLMKIAEALNVPKKLSQVARPALGLIVPGVKNEETLRAVALNLSANLLGLGNAATPSGLQAMRLLEEERALHPKIQHAQYLFLIANATGLQLLPTTVLTLRLAAGSANPNAILLPTILCTVASTVVGIGLGWLFKGINRHG